MTRFCLISLEWNSFNGFCFELFNVDLLKPIMLDGSIFGVYASRDFLYVDFLFMQFKVFDRY